MDIDVVALDMTKPFTAARARNAGFARLLELDPDVPFVQFLDGDCVVADGWLDRAIQTLLQDQPEVAVVFGLRRERFPDRSIYNRIADVEWNVPIGNTGPNGEVDACGGDAMIRVDAFQAVGGYDPSVPAGEEPELCQRLRARGWTVVRLDAPMTWHDSAMYRVSQWARRQFRTGYGGLDFSTRFGKPGNDPFRRQIRSAWIWSAGWPLSVALGTAVAFLMGGPMTAGAVGIALGAAPFAQAARIAWRNRGASRRAFRCGLGVWGASTVFGKLCQGCRPHRVPSRPPRRAPRTAD